MDIDPDLAVLTGVEPANATLKELWLYQFAYSTMKFDLAKGLRLELRSSVLETEMLPLHHPNVFGRSAGS
ncbi:hypothetical protein LBWT_29040 [Leptolyngbya boryana IAM M-101]|nr:hypothetical protein LBWT_29040 [Leptolyngbya boryana IAM M-101]BAS63324.1 hypothetical protein LBDG_29040 [Leptolyngbya boryana dg5]